MIRERFLRDDEETTESGGSETIFWQHHHDRTAQYPGRILRKHVFELSDLQVPELSGVAIVPLLG